MSTVPLRVAALLLLSLAVSDLAHAIPRFAIRNAADCQLCHVNPTGGGMRNSYGRNVYAAYTLPMGGSVESGRSVLNPEWAPTDDQRAAVGADLRTAIIHQSSQYVVTTDEDGEEELFKLPEVNSFFQMQSDLYLMAQLSKRFLAYIDYGVASGSLEAFGLYQPGWAGAYVKVGTFTPAYGLKLPNHRTYIREEGMGLEPNLRDSGIEIGAYPGSHGFSISFINGLGGGEGLNPDSVYAVTGKADVTLSTRPFKLTLGASGWYEPGGEIDPVDGTDQTTLDLRYGPYLMASTGRLTYLGEVDLRKTVDNAEETEYRSLASYNEVDFLAAQGLDITALFEFFDPETRLTPNTVYRVGGGFELFPSPNTELKLLYRHTLPMSEEDLAAAAGDERTLFSAASANFGEMVFFFHVFI